MNPLADLGPARKGWRPTVPFRWCDDEDRQAGGEAANAAKGEAFEARPAIKKIVDHGALVVASRVDTRARPGKTAWVSVASVCIIKDCLITDFATGSISTFGRSSAA